MSTTTLYPAEKSKTITIEKNNKNELFVKANNWMVEVFNDAESVIQFTDKESGVVTGKYLMATIIRGTDVPVEKTYAIIKINVKDNATRINIIPDSYINNYNPLAGGVSYPVEKANLEIEKLIASFEDAMKKEKDIFN